MKSLVQVTLSICLFLPFLAFGQIIEKPNCFQCDGNQAKGYKSMASGLGNIVLGNYAAGLGQNNISNGIGSLAAGVQCEASGDYAQAFGNIVKATARSSFASGFFSEANGVFSVAMGYGAKTGSHSAIALGFNVEALAPASFVTGRYVKSTASNAITMGSGNESAEYLSNNLPGTLMVGFNSIYPTLFVSRAPGGGNKTGRIGIGNITAPTAKLHIRADENEDATLYLQPSDWDNKYAALLMGTTENAIKAEKNVGLSFFTQKDFIFESGNVGIGTNTPGQKLAVAGNILAAGNINASGDIDFGGNLLQNGQPFQATKWQQNGANLFYDEGKVGIGTSTPPGLLSLYNTTGQHASASFQSGSSTRYWAGLNAANNAFVLGGTGGTMPETGAINVLNGNVGIGMLPTGNKALEVNGDINFTGQLYENGELLDINIWEQNGNFIYYNEGKVGIGTDTPTQTLHVEGSMRVSELASDIQKMIVTTADGTLATTNIPASDNMGNHIATQNINLNGKYLSGDGDGEGLYINNLGKIGVGTYYPIAQLQVNGGGNEVLGRFKSGYSSLNIGQSITGGGLGVWGSTYMGFNLRHDADNQWKTEYDGASNGAAMIYGTSGGDLIFTCVSTNPAIGGIQQLTDQQIKDNSKMILRSDGRLKAIEVVVKTNVWSDYVFSDDYSLMRLDQIEKYIKEHKHLPDVPSEAEILKKGINLGQMDAILLAKIEELTLYVIELKKENEEMRVDNGEMKNEIEKLKRR